MCPCNPSIRKLKGGVGRGGRGALGALWTVSLPYLASFWPLSDLVSKECLRNYNNRDCPLVSMHTSVHTHTLKYLHIHNTHTHMHMYTGKSLNSSWTALVELSGKLCGQANLWKVLFPLSRTDSGPLQLFEIVVTSRAFTPLPSSHAGLRISPQTEFVKLVSWPKPHRGHHVDKPQFLLCFEIHLQETSVGCQCPQTSQALTSPWFDAEQPECSC